MATKAPNSYKDPYWAELSTATEQKLGLPDGLLVSIVQNGERSNMDQVSEAGAKTVFQIIPQTRDAVVKKYGIDPYLSPENAAEAAGLLLKESLQRNNGDVGAAVAEYHGGTNRANWGPRTKAYVQRVVGTQQPAPQSGSTFSRALAAQQQPQAPQIAQVYEAYASGQMPAEEAAEFEADVRNGLVMLPRGASLKGQRAQPTGTGTPEPTLLPQEVSEAYASGQLSAQERAELEADMKAGLVKLPPTAASQIPGGQNWTAPTEQGVIAPAAEPSIADRLIGAGEAGLTALTGATGGALGMVTGSTGQIARELMGGSFGTPEAARRIEQAGAQASSNLTYAPRTAQGQEQVQAVGQFMGDVLGPLGGISGEVAALSRGVQAAKPAAQITAAAGVDAARQGAQQVAKAVKPPVMAAVEAVRNAPRRAAEMVGMADPAPTPPTGAPGRASINAAAVPQETVRIQTAENLPVPIKLTQGAASRDAAQLAFEKEQLKNPSLGAPLRARAEENNLQALQNFDTLIDMTGAQTPDLAAAGSKVVSALSDGYKSAKAAVRAAYKAAEKAGEMEAPVKLDGIADFLIQNAPEAEVAPILKVAKQKGIALGVLTETPDGGLVAQPVPLKTVELFRRSIGEATGIDPTSRLFAGRLRAGIDAATEGMGGEMYTHARALRQQQARKYENRAVVARLITNRKGMDDPKVAVDQVFRQSIMNGSPEEITFLKRVLNTSGKDGQQAWKELQGATMQHLRDEATKGMGMDSMDRPIVSPAKLNAAVTALDKNGRLDIVLGKKNAEIVRDLNDVVRYVNTTPPGTLINNSGTAGTIMAALAEAGVTGSVTGLPVPVISALKMLRNQVQDNKIKAKIQKALNAQGGNKF